MRAIQIQKFGGPEVLEQAELPDPQPANGLLLLEVSSSGVNYADTHKAENSYVVPSALPYVPGQEAVGTLPDGRRAVALLSGGYAEKALVHPKALFPADEHLTDGQALALVLQGNTAYHLLHTAARVRTGETVVVQAAAGGVGNIAVQLAVLAGTQVIAVASTAEKRALATELGASATVDSGAPDLTEAIRDANGGRPVDVVLEMVGGAAFTASLRALGRFGRLVSYGAASRVLPPPVRPGDLMQGSKSLIGFWLDDMFRRPQDLADGWRTMSEAVKCKDLRPIVGGTYPLGDARRAHEDLRSRTTIGKLVLDTTR